ncbi:hypothetical protein D3C76_1756550 [compost metagenome]
MRKGFSGNTIEIRYIKRKKSKDSASPEKFIVVSGQSQTGVTEKPKEATPISCSVESARILLILNRKTTSAPCLLAFLDLT